MRRLTFAVLGILAIVFSGISASRYVSADGIDSHVVPPLVTLAIAIWFVWTMVLKGAPRPTISPDALRRGGRVMALLFAGLLAWSGWMLIGQRQIHIVNLLAVGALLLGFGFFLARSFPPRGNEHRPRRT